MKKTYRSEWVKCGKGCGGCPHGPYWYAYWKARGKLHKEYIGRELPKAEPAKGRAEEPVRDWREDMLHERTASTKLAYLVLGVPYGSDFSTCRTAYRKLAMENHPDRGGDHKASCCISAAWSYLRKVKGWK